MSKPLSSILRILRDMVEGIERAWSILCGMPLNWLRGRTIRCLFIEFLVLKSGQQLNMSAFIVSPGLC